MPPQRARSPARLLAPAALGLIAVAAVVIVVSSGGGADGTPEGAPTAEQGTATTTRPAASGRRGPRSTYTVKRNDTLGSIAEKTGIEVERLQELNPQLDPQALIAGQKIKLRR